MRGLGHEVDTLPVDRDVLPLVTQLQSAQPDLVVNLAESFDGKSALDSSVTGLLNLLGLRYTGSSPAGLIAAGDKSLTKKILSFHGIQTPQFATLYRGAVDWAGDLTFPVIVKPPQEDASLGITSASVVHEIKDLFDRIHELQLEYQAHVLVEQFIEGRELYVGVMGNANVEALPIIELDFSGFPADRPRIASWEAKWGEDGEGSGAEFAGTKSIFPENLEPDLTERMKQIAIDSFQALRLQDYARIDLRVLIGRRDLRDRSESEFVTSSARASLRRAAQKSGLEYQDLIARIIDLATARYSQ